MTSRLDSARGGYRLLKGSMPMAELCPMPTGTLLGELEDVLAGLPALGATEAADFAADIESARAELSQDRLGDPCQS